MARLFNCLTALLLLPAVLALPAQADTFVVRMKSLHPNKVELKLFGVDRKVVWPGADRHYVLDDDNAHAMTLNCRAGERICFGAWVSGSGRPEWGTGKTSAGGCERCCYICRDGGKTGIITLNIQRIGGQLRPVHFEDSQEPTRPPKSVKFDDN